MSDINVGQIAEALNDKSDRDLRNVDNTAGADAVIEYQLPTAENDYTWYRKYKSGWVEQGGFVNTASGEKTVNFPVTMSDTYYAILKTMSTSSSSQPNAYNQFSFYSRTTTSAKTQTAGVGFSWQVSGVAN